LIVGSGPGHPVKTESLQQENPGTMDGDHQASATLGVFGEWNGQFAASFDAF